MAGRGELETSMTQGEVSGLVRWRKHYANPG